MSFLCVWNTDGWEKQKSRFLQLPARRTPPAQADTCVQFHQDQIHFLVVHETQLAIYEATKLECLKQFAVGLLDGGVYVFEPLESEGKWGVPPPIENGSTNNVATTLVGASSDEAQR
ncbi:hypothetical protein VNO77_04060 [Canavalia gladiata]|uniref:Uncharacterized protein n=1 Tax=Canavalia gladiata TaxID=3824 RepID=A0AAN9MVZ4_CANGL